MARIETDPNYSTPTFSRATAATDLFKKEDVQNLAAAISTHDHTTGKGAPLVAGSIPAGSITSAMIADATIDTADLKDSAVTSAKILDGTIATVDLANSAVTNAKLGADTARANLLTNGGFEIWQRGNGPFTTNAAYTADRWLANLTGGTFSLSRDSANADTPGSQYCAAMAYTFGAGGGVLVQQVNDQSGQLAGRQLTFSVRVKTSTANAVRARLYDGTTISYSSYHSGSGTYQTLTVTATMAAGTASMSVGLSFDASCTAYLDNAVLVVGSVAADYAPPHPADDLARCLRYYETMSGWSPMIATYNTAGSFTHGMAWLKAQKPITPTVTKTGTWNVTNCAQPTVNGQDVTSANMVTTATATGYVQSFPNTGSLTFEANP